MSKKDLRSEAATATDIIKNIVNNGAEKTTTNNTENNIKETTKDNVSNDVKTTAKKGRKPSAKDYKAYTSRLNFVVPTEIKDYLNEAAIRKSEEKKHYVSVTQYVCDLIAEDMRKNKNKK